MSEQLDKDLKKLRASIEGHKVKLKKLQIHTQNLQTQVNRAKAQQRRSQLNILENCREKRPD